MTLTRKTSQSLAIGLAILTAVAWVLLGNQRQVQAAVPSPNIPPNLGSQIVCRVFTDLNNIGAPIPVFDADCQNPPLPPAQCQNGIDDDGDGLVDLNDPGCVSSGDDSEFNQRPPPPPPPPPQCQDGLDNDNDGFIDLNDPGCSDSADIDETNGGGGTPPVAQCQDGIDNDNDGLVDMADPGCSGSTDNNETDSVGGGGGPPGGGSSPSTPPPTNSGGGGGPIGLFGTINSQGIVLGTSTSTPDCSAYLSAFIRTGQENDREQVRRLQYVLKEFEGAPIQINGIYDAATLAAVNRFQTKYAAEILTPWGINSPTGYVFLTTRKKVNEVYCDKAKDEDKQFSLTAAEAQHVQQVREQGANSPSAQGAGQPVAQKAPQVPLSTTRLIQAVDQVPTGLEEPGVAPQNTLPAAAISAEGTPPPSSPATQKEDRGIWGSILDFFGWVFDRGR